MPHADACFNPDLGDYIMHLGSSAAAYKGEAMALVRPRVLVTSVYEGRFQEEVFRGMVAYAHQCTDWQLVCQANVTAAQHRKIQARGVLTAGAGQPTHRWAHAAGIPLVMVANTIPDPHASVVHVDEDAVGAMAVEHLLGLGVKHLAYAGHGPWWFVGARRGGFVKAAGARGCGPVHQFIGTLYDQRRRRARCERDLRAMLEGLPRPCGVLAAADDLGVIIVQFCHELGLRVPEDIAVLGVDNHQLPCELSEVPLSSIEQPLFGIGYEGARLLHRQMQDASPRPTTVLLPPVRVVARASTDLIALDDEDVVAALRLINEHYAEPINVEWVARQLPVTRRGLYDKFMRLVGRTVLQQIHHVRLAKAKELLAESDLGLDAVARRSGFVTSPWMANSFRKELGTTPNRYRRQFKRA
jgi:LacI family transcriptional regulator